MDAAGDFEPRPVARFFPQVCAGLGNILGQHADRPGVVQLRGGTRKIRLGGEIVGGGEGDPHFGLAGRMELLGITFDSLADGPDALEHVQRRAILGRRQRARVLHGFLDLGVLHFAQPLGQVGHQVLESGCFLEQRVGGLIFPVGGMLERSGHLGTAVRARFATASARS
jgi:hypothetical protein